MERVKGKYDGEKIILEGPLKKREPGDVIVIFPAKQKVLPSATDVTGRTIARYLDGNPAFDFLNEPEEDIYSDKDLKIKYS
jgi:hypothetical protein